MTSYLLLLLGAFMFSVQFVFTKKYETVSGQSARAAMFFSLLSSIAGAIFLLCLCKFKPSFSTYSVIMAALLGTDYILINIIGMKAMHMGQLSVYTLFMMLGGMIVPFFLGVFALGEKPSVFCLIATMLVILSLSLPVFEKKKENSTHKTNKLFYVLCVLLFFLNGTTSCLSKLHQINKAAVDTYDLLFIMYVTEIILSGIVFWVMTATKKKVAVKLNVKSVFYPIAFILFSGTGAFITISSAKTVNASVLFPIVTGGTVIFSALCGRVLFKEKLNKYVISEVALAVAATVLFMF